MIKNYLKNLTIEVRTLCNNNNFFLPLIILFSGIKIYGYAISFMFFVPYVIFHYKELIKSFKFIKNRDWLITFYFVYLCFYTFIGAFSIKDIRIILFWIPFFLVALYSYIINIVDRKNKKYNKNNYINLIYIASLSYFILYFLFILFSIFYYSNPFTIQDNLWLGSSAAINISSLFLLTIYKKWEEINFNPKFSYYFSLIFYILILSLQQTRLGIIYLIGFTFFIFLRSIALKKFINFILIFLVIIYSYSVSYDFINKSVYGLTYNDLVEKNIQIHSNNNHKINDIYLNNEKIKVNYKSNLNIEKLNLLNLNNNLFIKELQLIYIKLKGNLNYFDNNKLLGGDDTRLIELFIAKNYFNELPTINKLLGTGWYSSRVLINESRNTFIDKISFRVECIESDCLPKGSVVQLQGIVAILLDLGIIGFIFSFVVLALNFLNIIKSSADICYKSLYLYMLIISVFSLFFGYPLVSVPFILFLLPKGISLI